MLMQKRMSIINKIHKQERQGKANIVNLLTLQNIFIMRKLCIV